MFNLRKIICLREKRAYPRLEVYLLSKYRLHSDSPGIPASEPRIAAIKNISGGGVCLELSEHIPASTLIQLDINFPQLHQAIPCVAKVAWIRRFKKTKKFEAGIQFLRIDDVLRQAISERVEGVHGKTGRKW
jgi:c-di-GMP-binding flagellar brake protein YcgR